MTSSCTGAGLGALPRHILKLLLLLVFVNSPQVSDHGDLAEFLFGLGIRWADGSVWKLVLQRF